MLEGGGNCLKYLKKGRTEKRGGKTKTLKRGEGKLGQGVGALKRGVGWNPLTNYDTFFSVQPSLDAALQNINLKVTVKSINRKSNFQSSILTTSPCI